MAERLSRTTVVGYAADLADQSGLDGLSFTKLARSLGVTPPAIYRHLEDIVDLKREISAIAGDEAAAAVQMACTGLAGFDALSALATTLRAWALEHPGRYAAMQTVAPAGEDLVQGEVDSFSQVLRSSLRAYDLEGEEFTHAARFVRSTVHGFITLELEGGFRQEVSVEESFARAIAVMHQALITWVGGVGGSVG